VVDRLGRTGTDDHDMPALIDKVRHLKVLLLFWLTPSASLPESPVFLLNDSTIIICYI
jgi:hypothetical protein